MSVLWVVLFSIVSAILYRAGGMSKDPAAKPTWMPKWMRDSLTRDIGCSLLLVGLSMILFPISKAWWGYVLTFGASWGFLTTYWDWTGKDNFYLHGLGCGIAGLFLIMCGIPWYIPVIRLVVCTLGMGIWSSIFSTDYIEEYGRGVFFIV